MAKLVIKYEAIDPYHSDQTYTFVGADLDECKKQMLELEEIMGRCRLVGIRIKYRKHFIEEKP